MLGQLTGQPETNGSLDFPASDGVLLVVLGKSRRLGSDPLEDVVDKRVHDAHSLAGDTSLWVDLLENLVDVDGI